MTPTDLIQQYGHAVTTGALAGALAGTAVDALAMRTWFSELDTASPDWAEKLGMEVRAYDWRKATKRAAIGAAIGAAAAIHPALGFALGLPATFSASTPRRTDD